ncbi:MAG TPA: 5'/3'-nucleotidase SurE [Candidatus Bathyarchaeia archaeon]|nr:5'/3'-nucleotidase SurE [Candidatus Bathyarchaeia archaeon]
MLRILLTNDDGIDAQGIRRLAEALVTLPDLEIFVVAPAEERSGVGHGVTFREALSPQPHEFYGLPVKAWAINGNPADCVKAAYHLLFAEEKKFDIVFSGINVGYNLGRDIYYSGTCSGAREAVIHGIPGVALSYGNWEEQESFGAVSSIVQPLLKRFIQQAADKDLPAEVFWNVNIPHLPAEEIKGVAPAVLSLYHYHDEYQKAEEGYWLGRKYPEEGEHREEDDYRLVNEGYIAVTPVHIDATDRSLLTKVGKWFSQADPS